LTIIILGNPSEEEDNLLALGTPCYYVLLLKAVKSSYRPRKDERASRAERSQAKITGKKAVFRPIQ
jgi:hypothetical protein